MSYIKASVVAVFSGMFYKGLQLIPTYPDGRLKTSIEKSFDYLNKGSNIIIFPEDISKGYFDVLYHNIIGVMIMSVCLTVYILAYLMSEKITEIE